MVKNDDALIWFTAYTHIYKQRYPETLSIKKLAVPPSKCPEESEQCSTEIRMPRWTRFSCRDGREGVWWSPGKAQHSSVCAEYFELRILSSRLYIPNANH